MVEFRGKNDIVLIFDRSLVVYVFHFQCFPNVRRSPRPWKKRKVLRSVDPLVAVLQVLVGLLVVRERSTVRPTVLWKRSSYSCNSKGVRQVGIKKKRLQHFSQSIFSIFFTSFVFHSLALGSLCHEALDGELGGLDSSPKAAPSSKAAALVDVQLPFATYSEHLETVGPTGRTCDCDQTFCDTSR